MTEVDRVTPFWYQRGVESRIWVNMPGPVIDAIS